MVLRSSNPTLNEGTFNRHAYLTGTDPQSLMTVSGTLNKCLILAFLLLGAAGTSWIMTMAAPGMVMPAVVGGLIGGLIISLVICFKPETSPFLAPAYAVVEGILLGAFSQFLNKAYPGIAVQAMLITIATLLTMLGLYRTGIIRATPMFTKVVVIATVGIGVMYLISLAMRLFGGRMPLLNDSGPIGIGISLVICVIAALNFILDFDTIERGAEQGAPKFMEWRAAFGLMVTVVWLYLEVLRLLRKLRD